MPFRVQGVIRVLKMSITRIEIRTFEELWGYTSSSIKEWLGVGAEAASQSVICDAEVICRGVGLAKGQSNSRDCGGPQ